MTVAPGMLRYHAAEARRDVEYWNKRALDHEASVSMCRKNAEQRLRQAEEYEELANRNEITAEYRVLEAAE